MCQRTRVTSPGPASTYANVPIRRDQKYLATSLLATRRSITLVCGLTVSKNQLHAAWVRSGRRRLRFPFRRTHNGLVGALRNVRNERQTGDKRIGVDDRLSCSGFLVQKSHSQQRLIASCQQTLYSDFSEPYLLRFLGFLASMLLLSLRF